MDTKQPKPIKQYNKMKKIISILHISDLHRNKGNGISNAALLSSLINDKDTYSQRETPQIKSPDIIIVSGDVIRGSTKLDGSANEVKIQYDEAIEFLNDLTEHFLSGDKNKIVIVPGNHDVDWKISIDSMTKIDSSNIWDISTNNVKSEYLINVGNYHSNMRWSWQDLSFYEIIDQDKYKARLKAFSDFYESFYEGKRKFSIEPDEQYGIFDFPQFNLTIVAFSSCYDNDHLRFAGDIHPNCIAKANMQLKEFIKKGRLIAATWHHNTKGPPYSFNYMDSRKLKNFIDLGISIGFHGHQHKTELIHEFSDIVEQKKILVFSTGTLCGGPSELPAGNNRQYNIIEIDWKTDTESTINVQLHVREKTESSPFGNPIWAAGRIDSNLISHHTIEIEKPKLSDITSILVDIEILMKNKNYEDAKTQLLDLNLSDEFVRKFLEECIIQTDDFKLALEVFDDPKTNAEFIVASNAACQLNNKGKMRLLIEKAKSFISSDSPTKELVKRMEAMLK